jgi:hypothetical protein
MPHGQTQFSSTACPGIYGTRDGSPKCSGPLPRLARPNSRCITHDNQNTSHQPPTAQLTKKSWWADVRTFHRHLVANHQFGNHIRTRGGGWVFDVRKSALRLDFEPAWGERLKTTGWDASGAYALGPNEKKKKVCVCVCMRVKTGWVIWVQFTIRHGFLSLPVHPD